MNGKKHVSERIDQPEAPAESVTGLDNVGGDDASQSPDEDKAISLPVEEGDFNAQPQ